MTTERCRFCGRTLEQNGRWRMLSKHIAGCLRCSRGEEQAEIAHAKAVRIAWKWRKIACELRKRTCKWKAPKGMCVQGVRL